MSEPIKTFWVEPTSEMVRYLRRYRRSDNPCGCSTETRRYTCDAMEYFDRVPIPYNEQGYIGVGEGTSLREMDRTDPRWPTKCKRCDYVFDQQDEWQVFQDVIYVRPETGEELSQRSLPTGAIFNAWWHDDRLGADGMAISVQTPAGEWLIDGESSNCQMKHDKTHRCWIRHGDPKSGYLHVDKHGHTCGAGAGSVFIGTFHGFLHHGYLISD